MVKKGGQKLPIETCALVALYFLLLILHEKKFSEEEIRQKTALTAYCEFKCRVAVIYLCYFIDAQKTKEKKSDKRIKWAKITSAHPKLNHSRRTQDALNLYAYKYGRMNQISQSSRLRFFFLSLSLSEVFLFISIFFLSYVDCHYYCYYYHQTSNLPSHRGNIEWSALYIVYEPNMLTVFALFSFALSVFFFIFALQML